MALRGPGERGERDTCSSSGGEVGGDVTVGGVEHVDRVELEPLAEWMVIVVDDVRQVLRGARRLEGELGPGSCGSSQPRAAPAAPEPGPAAPAAQRTVEGAESGAAGRRGPAVAARPARGRDGPARAWCRDACIGSQRLRLHRLQQRSRGRGPTRGASPARGAVAGFSARRRKARRSRTCAVSTNGRPHVWKGMPRRPSSTSRWRLWCEARKRAPPAKVGPLRALEDAPEDELVLTSSGSHSSHSPDRLTKLPLGWRSRPAPGW